MNHADQLSLPLGRKARDAIYEKKFPGMKSTPIGIDYQLPLAAETMKGWRP
jgi:hypothetical protein